MKNEPQILLIGLAPDQVETVRAAARQLGKFRVEAVGKVPLASLQVEALDAAAVIVAVQSGEPAALDDFHRLSHILPDRKLIAAPSSATAEDVRRLFRAGAADVLPSALSLDAVVGSLSELLRRRTGAVSGQGRIISVLKTGGGAGATTAALNLAAIMAGAGAKRRQPARRTAVLDLDTQFGDTDVALDLQPRSTLVDILRAEGRVDARFLESVMTEHATGLKLLAPPTSVVPLDAVTPELALTLLDHSASQFERTFVDLPAAWSDWTFQVLSRSDVILLVSTPTVAGALGARRVLDALKEAKVQRPVFFALNKLNGVIDAFEKPARIGKTLDMGVDAALAFDANAVKAADRGKLVVEAYPSSRLAKDLAAAAAKLERRLEALESGAAVAEVDA
ncbi:AAA family ATPase [Phenylobacterium deserti]|uniref:Uncharacterized protein n=1 Tax=Phenylobacterium deserti TaxID=1914756 RepID=A0A328AGG2_9CAUL|nr:AAA family ATPase [Phenylobacterium deserti]RAK52534.1 hypothetical protein DJ018_09985 [Phenylobacterium deserti]